MKMRIKVTADAAERTSEFKYLWAKFVTGANLDVHCAKCLLGPYSKVIRVGMELGESILDAPVKPFDFFYLCGVTARWETNLHLAARRAPGKTAKVTAFNGTVFEIPDFELIPIHALPVGFMGKLKAFTTCRNWQFAVQEYS